MNINLIAEKENCSTKTISREIDRLLLRPPDIKTVANQNTHLLIDGTYFKRTNCLILYFDSDLKYFQSLRYSTGEIKEEIIKDLRVLKRNGVNIVSRESEN